MTHVSAIDHLRRLRSEALARRQQAENAALKAEAAANPHLVRYFRDMMALDQRAADAVSASLQRLGHKEPS